MSAYVLNEKGQRVIPASRRPDGTWRKEIIVKEGYTAQDEVVTYAARSSKPRGIPGLAPQAQPVIKQKQSSKPTNKDVSAISAKINSDLKLSDSKPAPTPTTTATATVSKNVEEKQEVDPAKKLKALKKKQREILELQQRVKNENHVLSPEQQAKVDRLGEIEAEILSLEA